MFWMKLSSHCMHGAQLSASTNRWRQASWFGVVDSQIFFMKADMEMIRFWVLTAQPQPTWFSWMMPFMMKVIVWYFVSETCTAVTTFILVRLQFWGGAGCLWQLVPTLIDGGAMELSLVFWGGGLHTCTRCVLHSLSGRLCAPWHLSENIQILWCFAYWMDCNCKKLASTILAFGICI